MDYTKEEGILPHSQYRRVVDTTTPFVEQNTLEIGIRMQNSKGGNLLVCIVKSSGRCLSKSDGIIPIHKILIVQKLAGYFTYYS